MTDLSGNVTHTEEFVEELDIESTNVPSGSEVAEEEAPTEETTEEVVVQEPTAEEKEAEEQAATEKKPWFQKRFDKLAKQKGEAERKVAELEQVLAMQNEPQPQQQQPLQATRQEPTLESCEYDQDRLTKELVDWSIEQRDVHQRAANQQRQTDINRHQYVQSFNAHREDVNRVGEEKFDDWQAVVIDGIPGSILNNNLAAALFESKAPADVAYYLGKNLEEAAAISRMQPLGMAMELARLESKAVIPPKEKQTTKAPEPVVPVGKKSGANAEPDPKSDPNGWLKWERARTKKLGRLY